MAMDGVHEMTPMAMDGSDLDDDDVSVHSAISNASEFEDDEEVEYLAMDLVNHLPPEKASKLLKNMRTKEKAVQDLLHRNRSLLDSCQSLDEENQALSVRLQEAETQAAAAPPPQPAAPPASVDTSFFQKMERGKEEKILRLQKERDQLMMQVRRLDEGGQKLEEALVQARKEIKKMQSQQGQQPVQQVQAQRARAERADSGAGKSSLLDEEERMYQELQGNTKRDAALVQQQQQQQQQRQEENKKRIHAALQSLLKDDMARMERWGSDIAALLLAVDGLEAQMRPGGKDKAAAKKGKAVQNSSHSASSERLAELSTQVLDDFDALRGQLENTEKLQLSLEQTARGVHDGADAIVVAMDLDASLAGAEREAACIQEHAQRAGGLNLRPTAELLGRTEATLDTLLTDAPPGLIPPHAQTSLSEARGQISQLRRQLDEQTQMLAELQDGTASRAQALQAALRAHREQLSRKAAEELQRSAAAFEQPLQHMRGGLRQQSEAVTRARGRVSGALEELAAAARRSAADGSLGGSELPKATGAGNEALLGGIRDVRSMGRSLISGLEEGGKALEGRFLKVYTALVGEEAPPSGGGGAQSSRPGSGAAAGAGARAGGPESAAEAKKKKGKKKGKGEQDGAQATEQPQAGGNAAPADQEGKGGGGAGQRRPDEAEESRLRKEFASLAEQDGATRKSSDKTSGRSVLKGAELLQELKSLRSDADKLEARIAERRKASQAKSEEPDADAAGDGEAEEPAASRPAPKARRKKMFV